MFLYVQLSERFKLDKKLYGFTAGESQLEVEETQVISKMYKWLLKYKTEDVQVKECL